jgi:tetratricopeptide (TPR) repeat protein
LQVRSEFAGLAKTHDSTECAPTDLVFAETATPITHSDMFELAVHCKEGIELMENSRVELTLWEVTEDKADKKKKKKEASEREIGTVSVPLDALVFDGASKLTGSFAVVLAAPDPLATSDSPTPMVEVEITLDKPLMSPEQTEEGNLMRVALQGAFSLPDLFQVAAQNISFGLTVPLPTSGPGQTFNDGICNACSDDVPKPSYSVDGTGRSSDDRAAAETTGNSVRWSGRTGESVVFLDKAAQVAMIAQIAKCRSIPVEFKRYSKEAGKGKKGPKDGGSEELFPGYHAMAFADISSLIYPGQVELTGAFALVPYDEAALETESGKSREELDELLTPTKPGDKKKAAPKKDPAVEELAKEQSVIYATSGTYVAINVTLTRPLIPKRTTESFSTSISELIPARDMYPKHTMTGDEAVSELHSQIAGVATQLLGQFRAKKVEGDNDPAATRQALFYDLNTTGKFFAYKEQIKRAVVKVVREKFSKTDAISDPSERQAFLTELYSFLMEQMHTTLNKSFAFSTADLVAPVSIEVEDIRRFAKEAEGRGLLELAAKYHQECIARLRTDVECWYDYGCFCMRAGDFAKAEECFREGVSLNQTHGPSILLAAVIAWANEQFDVATSLFEVATHYLSNGVSWTVRKIYHTLLEDTISADMCAIEADKHGGKQAAHMATARFLLQLNVPTYLEGVLRELKLQEDADGFEPTAELDAIFAEFHIAKGEVEKAEELLNRSIQTDVSNLELWILRGHLNYSQGGTNLAEAASVYQRALDLPGEHADRDLIRNRLAALYLNDKEYTKAKALYLEASAKTASALTWEGAGIACYRLGNLTEAEKALAESNMYDNTNAQVWAYLALISLSSGRRHEAEQTYKYAIRHGLADEALISEVVALQKKVGFGNPFVDGQ